MISSASKLLSSLLIVSLCCAGCGDEGPARKPTFPVTGEIFVDGQPAENVAVTLHNVNGYDKDLPTESATMTKEQGKFALSTYEEGDGAPAGEYTVTFSWGELNLMSMQYQGDKLKGKYSDPQKAEHKVTVSDQPVDMGRIELTTK
jgi:hypothetical protein